MNAEEERVSIVAGVAMSRGAAPILFWGVEPPATGLDTNCGLDKTYRRFIYLRQCDQQWSCVYALIRGRQRLARLPDCTPPGRKPERCSAGTGDLLVFAARYHLSSAGISG